MPARRKKIYRFLNLRICYYVKKINQSLAIIALISLGFRAESVSANYTVSLISGIIQTNNAIYEIHIITLWICVFATLMVFVVMFYSIYFYRKSKECKAKQFHKNAAVEFIWTIIPALILIGMAITATTTIINTNNTATKVITE